MSVPPPSAEAPPANASAPGDLDRWGLWMAPAALIIGIGIALVLGGITAGIGHAAGGSARSHPSPAVNLISSLLTDAAFVVAAIYVVSRGRPLARVTPAEFGFRRTPPIRAGGAVFMAAATYYVLTLVYANVFHLHGSDKLPSELGVSHSTAALIGAAAFVCVVAPITEEFFFRGFLLRVLSSLPLRIGGRDQGPWLAAVLVGILFGAAHLGSASPQYLIPLGFLGFVLCALKLRTGSLYPGIALHSLNNSLALGVNSLHWSGAGILGLIVAALAVIGALVLPLSRDASAVPAPG